MDRFKRSKVTKRSSSEDSILEIQTIHVQNAKIQQLPRRFKSQKRHQDNKTAIYRFTSKELESHLCDLDVGFLRELRNEEISIILQRVHLGVELQPRDDRLRTELPLQRLQYHKLFSKNLLLIAGPVRHISKLLEFWRVNFLSNRGTFYEKKSAPWTSVMFQMTCITINKSYRKNPSSAKQIQLMSKFKYLYL